MPALHVVGLEGAGQHLAHRADGAVAVEEAVGPAVLEQQLAAATAGHDGLTVARHRHHGDQAAAATGARAETSPHSAHNVSPYEAFSTLQPLTMRPSSARPAAPTWKWEYGDVGVLRWRRPRRHAARPSRCSRSWRHSLWPLNHGRPSAAGGRRRWEAMVSTSSVTT